jgi:hypothetical protein
VVRKEKEGIKEKRVDVDMQVHPEQLVPRVHQDHKEKEDTRAKRVNVEKQESQVRLDLWAKLVLLDQKVKPAIKVRTEKMVNLVFLELEVL